ncbi:MAG: DNA repair protein, partial [Lachnospiraceae bacterium]|nr:DNA repair protein [Lachnospiraceae bacterium]
MEKTYLCIDLKSFYASVECAERGLDAMTTNLVVADTARSVNTICLAISPAMKRLGVKNRCRVGEIPRGISYITALPRMQKYIDYSAEIYAVYLHYIAKEDIHVYSVDEAFMDVTPYLRLYHMSARELGIRIMQEIWDRTRIRASCGVGSNLYLAKIALDIAAKPSLDAVGELDEQTYIRRLWRHRPLTDFWRVGAGMAKKLSSYGIDT